ncbi:hypothetical protein A2U01_0089155, partial [Trifolium medium]|nr:hypothetical protein [Trifolium medium]
QNRNRVRRLNQKQRTPVKNRPTTLTDPTRPTEPDKDKRNKTGENEIETNQKRAPPTTGETELKQEFVAGKAKQRTTTTNKR